MHNELQASLAGQGNHDGLHALRHMVDAPSRLSVPRSTLQDNPVLVAGECVASAVSDVSVCSVAASLLAYLLVSVSSLPAYLLVSVAAPVEASFVFSPASLPAHSVALASGFLVPFDAPASALS